MRNMFLGYYEWTQAEFDELWEKAIFAFDANTLLNIYRYKENTCGHFLETLDAIKERVWLPYQAAYEFHKNRRNCIDNQVAAYTDLKKLLQRFETDFDATLRGYKNHKTIDGESLRKQFSEALSGVIKSIDESHEDHPDDDQNSSLLLKMTDIFDNRVGDKLPDSDLKSIYKEGRDRYAAKVPPGYKDIKKPEPAKYGDLVLWKELIRKSTDCECPIIFITSDGKEDWWLVEHGKQVGPNPELIQEFLRTTNQRCYLYSPSQFIKRARHHFKLGDTDQATLNEIKTVRSTKSPMRGLLGETFLDLWNKLDQQFQEGLPDRYWSKNIAYTSSEWLDDKSLPPADFIAVPSIMHEVEDALENRHIRFSSIEDDSSESGATKTALLNEIIEVAESIESLTRAYHKAYIDEDMPLKTKKIALKSTLQKINELHYRWALIREQIDNLWPEYWKE